MQSRSLRVVFPWLARFANERHCGPFRSEVECEEFCDRCNLARNGKYTLYDKSLYRVGGHFGKPEDDET